MRNTIWFLCGVILGITTLSTFASIPKKTEITNDVAIYQNLSDIRVKPEKEMSFDSDISRLSKSENRYHEKLVAHPRLQAPLKRVAHQRYAD